MLHNHILLLELPLICIYNCTNLFTRRKFKDLFIIPKILFALLIAARIYAKQNNVGQLFKKTFLDSENAIQLELRRLQRLLIMSPSGVNQ